MGMTFKNPRRLKVGGTTDPSDLIPSRNDAEPENLKRIPGTSDGTRIDDLHGDVETRLKKRR